MDTGDSLKPGSVVAQRFDITSLCGSGGMAHVYRATDRKTNREVALKLLRPGLGDYQNATKRLRREGEILNKLRHPSVVPFDDTGYLPDGSIFLSMKYLSGETLQTRLLRAPLEPKDFQNLMIQLCDAVAAAHEVGVVHRDLKPANIFLCTDGSVKLLDFGVSKALNKEKLTMTGQVLGTPRYMSAEQLAGDPVSAKSDQYALGAIAYECISANPAFPQKHPSDLVVAVMNGDKNDLKQIAPEGFRDSWIAAIEKALSVQEEHRFSDVRAFANALDALPHSNATRLGMHAISKSDVLSVPPPTTSDAPSVNDFTTSSLREKPSFLIPIVLGALVALVFLIWLIGQL